MSNQVNDISYVSLIQVNIVLNKNIILWLGSATPRALRFIYFCILFPFFVVVRLLMLL